MGIRIGFFVIVLLIALSIWAYDYWEKKRKAKKPTVDELISTVVKQIQEIQENADTSSEEAREELAHCKTELSKLKNIKIKNQKQL